MSDSPTPTTLLCGFLGAGKSTAILSLLKNAPKDERWAVLVNEFGEIGIDEAIIDTQQPGLVVKQVAGGCVCCSAGVPFQVAITTLLRNVRPDRLLIEPSGLADPATLIDILRKPVFRQIIDLKATLGLVHPRHLSSVQHREHPIFAQCLQVSDILLLTHGDQVEDAEAEAALTLFRGIYPKKIHVDVIEHGQIPAKWLTISPKQLRTVEHVHNHDEFTSAGWIFPTEMVFDRQKLQLLIQELVHPCAALSLGTLRLKGVFRTKRRWQLIQGTAETISWQGTPYRRDSRVELITASPTPDWEAVRELFIACSEADR